jgi:hypothetical protein
MRTLDFLAVAAAVLTLALGGCRANVVGQEASRAATAQPIAAPSSHHAPGHRAPSATQTRVESDADRAVRGELDRAFARDANLKGQNVIFTVDSGDVTLTGNVKTEKEREKANEVAINVPGVRSVANALRVSP